MPFKLVFMGTPHFAVPTLEALHKAGHEVAAVYTQPPRPAGRGMKDTPSPVHLYAQQHGFPVYTPASLKTPEAQAEFAAHGAQIAVVVAYGLLLPKPILEAYPLGCINVHPSLLPRWRGAAPIQRSIMAGDTQTAIVIMQMDKGLDTGDMLLVEKYPIPVSYNAGRLQDELSQKAGPLVLRTLDGLQQKTILPVKQPSEGVTYAQKITNEECRIDWNLSGVQIHHLIRGLSPSPGAYFMHNGEKIKIFEADFTPQPSSASKGSVISEKLDIQCEGGILTPLEIQRPGKKRMRITEALHGFSIPIGTQLA